MKKNNRTLVISDTHFPYHHPDTFDFLMSVRAKYDPDRVIHDGDVTDQYCFSRYPKDPEYDEGYSAEFQALRENVRQLHSIFPDMDIVSSNHDDRAWDRAKTGGIPRSVLRPFMELIGAESFNWKLHHDLLLTVDYDKSRWYFAHHRGNNVLREASKLGVNVVTGHQHTKLACDSIITLNGRIWGCSCGCLIGDDTHAFAYNRMSVVRPNLGVIFIENGCPRCIPMDVIRDEEGVSRWDRIVR